MKIVKLRSAFKLILSVTSIASMMACSSGSTNLSGTSANAGAAGILTISPSTVSVLPNGTTTFAATGGTPPYAFYRSSGSGTINATTGAYTASSVTGTDYIEVVDSASGVSYAVVTITTSASSSTLAISPTAVNVAVNGNYTFTATGGTGSYNYYMVYGTGTVVQSSGYFIAPGVSETDEIEVIDSASNVAYATITVGTGAGGNLTEVYQLYNSSNNDYLYSTSSSEGASAGFVYEGSVFKMYPSSTIAGTMALYRCRTTGYPQNHFLSNSSNCEGKIYESLFGYVYSSGSVNGLLPLYRFASSNGNTHLVTTNYSEGSASGLIYQEILGYAFAP